MQQQRQCVVVMLAQPDIFDLHCRHITRHRHCVDQKPRRRVRLRNRLIYKGCKRIPRNPFQAAVEMPDSAHVFMHGLTQLFGIVLAHAFDIGLNGAGDLGKGLGIGHGKCPDCFAKASRESRAAVIK